MEKQMCLLRFEEEAKLDPAEIGEFLFLFPATYKAAVQLIDNDMVTPTSKEIRRLASKLEKHLRSLNPVQLELLFHQDLGEKKLETVSIGQNSPLEFVFAGVVVAFVIAVILAGGSFEIPGVIKVDLPIPLGDSIKKLREGVSSQKKKHAAAKLTTPLRDANKRLRRVLAPHKKTLIGYGVRSAEIKLSEMELEELDKQNPAQREHGGFQRFLVDLQERVNRKTGVLVLNSEDIDRIIRFGSNPRVGGFQSRIHKIFENHLKFDENI